MNHSLEKQILIKRERLDNSDYLRSLANEAVRVGVISKGEYKTFIAALFGLLSEDAQRFTKDKSSSVRTEVAKVLLDSICFKIGIYLKGICDCDHAARLLVEIPIKRQLSSGQKLLDAGIRTALSLNKKLQSNRQKTTDNTYNILYDKGLKQCFRSYKRTFAAHDSYCLSELCYPLAVPVADRGDGAMDFLIRYEKTLYWENEFCALFEDGEIERLRAEADPNRQSNINLFEKALLNACANLLLSNAGALSLENEDVYYLVQKFGDNLPPALAKAGEMLTGKIHAGDEFLAGYIAKYYNNIKSSFTNAQKSGNFNTLFTVWDKKTTNRFCGEARLSTQKFRELADEIRFCETIEKKIALFGTVTSMTDFIELLEADCLYADEYKAFYRALSAKDNAFYEVLTQFATEYDTAGNAHDWVSELLEHYEV